MNTHSNGQQPVDDSEPALSRFEALTVQLAVKQIRWTIAGIITGAAIAISLHFV